MKGKGEDMNIIISFINWPVYIFTFSKKPTRSFLKKNQTNKQQNTNKKTKLQMDWGRGRWKQGMSHTDSLDSVYCRESVAKRFWGVKEEGVS